MGPVCHKVMALYVISVLGAQPGARPVVEVQPVPFGLYLRDFEAFPFPDPLHP